MAHGGEGVVTGGPLAEGGETMEEGAVRAGVWGDVWKGVRCREQWQKLKAGGEDFCSCRGGRGTEFVGRRLLQAAVSAGSSTKGQSRWQRPPEHLQCVVLCSR